MNECNLCGANLTCADIANCGTRCQSCWDAFAAGQAFERERCADMAEHCAHSCTTEAHCDFLHAAHQMLADQIRSRR